MSSQPPKKKNESSGPAPKQPSAGRRVKKSAQKINTEQEDESEFMGGGRFLLFTVVPSWIISLLTHVSLILVAAFFALPRPPAKSISFEGAPPSDSPVESVDISLDAFDDVSEEPPAELAASNPAEVTEPTEAIAPEATVDVGEILAGVDSTMELETSPLESTSVTASNETSMRTGNARGEALRKFGGSAESESAVKLALKWIVDHQLPDGGWDLNHQLGPGNRTSPDPGVIPARNAATALALLPLLGDGQTHKSGEYREAVFNGLRFLLERGRPIDNGISFYEKSGTMYSHGLVSIVLCEAYAMTEDPELAPFAQKAINFIEQTQNGETDGGWGYGHSRHRPASVSDMSIVGWQLMALKSAIGSDLRVRPRTIKLTKKYMAHIGNPDNGVFGYDKKPTKPNARLRSCTAIGALCRMYLGAEKDADDVNKSIGLLAKWGPDSKKDRVANMYYNYYATQVMKQYGGDKWRAWNSGMRDFLVKQQEKEGAAAGSWMFDERWASQAGRLYATSLSCMTLEVYYRFLPLYDESVLDEDFPL